MMIRNIYFNLLESRKRANANRSARELKTMIFGNLILLSLVDQVLPNLWVCISKR